MFCKIYYLKSFVLNLIIIFLIESSKVSIFTDRLLELESSLEQQRNNIRFYTPSAPVIGINGSINSHMEQQEMNINTNSSTNILHNNDSNVYEDEIEDVINESITETDQDIIMGDLEDSTNSPIG